MVPRPGNPARSKPNRVSGNMSSIHRQSSIKSSLTHGRGGINQAGEKLDGRRVGFILSTNGVPMPPGRSEWKELGKVKRLLEVSERRQSGLLLLGQDKVITTWIRLRAKFSICIY